MRLGKLLICLCLTGSFSLTVLAQSTKHTDQSVEKVFVAFKTHLDIGFTGLSKDVVDLYHHEFIPSALTLSENLLKKSSQNSYSWTTGSWLVWDYLKQSSSEKRNRMEAAIKRGDFWWHAFPFTMQVELCDSSLLSASLFLSEALDKRFGRKTCAAKITDVPGVPRNMIPILKRHGITLLHLGANPGAACPQLPEVFRWQNGVNGDAVNVIRQTDYAKPFKIPFTNNIVSLNFTNDNHGPHSEKSIEEIYARLREEYPKARIIPSSLNEIAVEVEKIQDQLPVVTQEWGDSWMYGTASDPKKIAEFRQLMRLRNKWINEKKLLAGSDTDISFVVPLLLVAEHTWGLDVKTFLKSYDRYQFDKYPEFLNSEEAEYIERSWGEQRAYIYQAISALPADLGRETTDALNELTPKRPMLVDSEKYEACKMIKTKFFQVGFDMNTGAINYLKDKKTGKQWAGDSYLLGEFTYQIYSGDDFKNFISQYCPKNPAEWMLADYGKPGLDKLGLKNRIVNYAVKEIVVEKQKEMIVALVHLSLTTDAELYGAPQDAFIKYSFDDKQPTIGVELSWFNKHKNRIPEAIWFSFHPCLNQAKVYVDKLDMKVDLQDVVYNGARTIHGITKNIYFTSDGGDLCIESMDASLVQFNKRALLSYDNEIVKPEQGVHVCLLNTLWGTNYTQWFGDDMKFRFSMHF